MSAHPVDAWKRILQLRADVTLAEAESLLNFPHGFLLSAMVAPEDYIIVGHRLMFGGAFLAALAANFSEVCLFNTSTRLVPSLCIVEGMSTMRSGQVLEIFTAPLAVGVARAFPRDLNLGTAAQVGVGRISTGTNVAQQGLQVSELVTDNPPTSAYSTTTPSVLAPQTGIGGGGNVVNLHAGWMFWWRELDLRARGG